MSRRSLKMKPWPEGIRTLWVPYVMPSLNALFAMNWPQRCRERKKCVGAFGCALLAVEQDALIQTTSAPSTSSTVSGLVEPSQETASTTSKLSFDNEKQPSMNKEP